MTRGEALIVRAFAVWTVWIWATRIGNVMGDDTRSTAFKVIHVLLAVVSVAFAVAAWLVVRRVRRRDAHR
ncbi:MAG TPA: hypothetical protein VFB78_10105 [Acidimicrobiales bacterium]|nr:hypothetical protein [Acidimicrobiales bacterium]